MKEIFLAFVQVFAMMAPWLVFGFLMAGIIYVISLVFEYGVRLQEESDGFV